MARKRMIDPSLWQDEGMAELTPRQQLLYIGMFSNADDDGRMKGSASAIRLTLPTVYAGCDLADIDADIDAVLGQFRQLTRYEAGGRVFIGFLNYRKWQRIDKPSPSILPEPPTERDHSENVRRTVVEDSPNILLAVPPSIVKEKIVKEKGSEVYTSRASTPASAREDGDADAPRYAHAPTPLVRPAPKPKDAPPVDRPRDLLFEAVCDACLIDWHQLTDSERGRVNHATAQIRKAGGTPDSIPTHAAHYRLHFNTPLTPMALAGNWSLCANAPPAAAARAPNGRRPTVEDANEAELRRIVALENGHEPNPFPDALDADWFSHEQGDRPRPLRPVVAQVRGAPR